MQAVEGEEGNIANYHMRQGMQCNRQTHKQAAFHALPARLVNQKQLLYNTVQKKLHHFCKPHALPAYQHGQDLATIVTMIFSL